MHCVRMLIRRENAGDVDAVAEVHRQAFDGDAPVEVGLVTRLRSSDDWIPQLALVADIDGTVVGHVCLTRATVDATDVLALGPIGVLPGLQRDGVGSALMHAVLGGADARDEPLVALLGHLDYYPRFGFVSGTSVGIEPDQPSWSSHFQVRRLACWDPSITGTFRYAVPFYDL
ncbi:putative acetyltransferase [Rhodococcus koreensis]|uniref:Putative acetyltransferase n=2 Tax=Rhodococcus koreensis TaxID=99653 RepID=A0A1H4Z9P9_9NOCA|nr:putative acetyltransferase [Rhodococcus koreensis]